MHAAVRLKFAFAKGPDLQLIAKALDQLVQLRNQASYDLHPLAVFASDARAQRAVQEADTGLAVLDAIDGDPARRAAAIASLPP
jgi:hypothetical protein